MELVKVDGRLMYSPELSGKEQGTGTLEASSAGLKWEIGRLFRSSSGSIFWHQLHSLGFSSREVVIGYWNDSVMLRPSAGRSVVEFQGDPLGIRKIEGLAREKLRPEAWRSSFEGFDSAWL